MTIEQIKKGLELSDKINHCKNEIKDIEWMLGIEPRKTYLSVSGTQIVVPESIYMVIGKMLLSEYRILLTELEEEFNKL